PPAGDAACERGERDVEHLAHMTVEEGRVGRRVPVRATRHHDRELRCQVYALLHDERARSGQGSHGGPHRVADLDHDLALAVVAETRGLHHTRHTYLLHGGRDLAHVA